MKSIGSRLALAAKAACSRDLDLHHTEKLHASAQKLETSKECMGTPESKAVDYLHAARRHMRDASILHKKGSTANAGQLYGFSIECAQKQLLLACGVKQDSEGGVGQKEFRQHLPHLNDATLLLGELLPDGRKTLHYCSQLPSLALMGSWSVDQRYMNEAGLPLAHLKNWQLAANEALAMVDELILDGVVYDISL